MCTVYMPSYNYSWSSNRQSAILNFRFSQALHNIDNCSVELLDFENMGVVAAILYACKVIRFSDY